MIKWVSSWTERFVNSFKWSPFSYSVSTCTHYECWVNCSSRSECLNIWTNNESNSVQCTNFTLKEFIWSSILWEFNPCTTCLRLKVTSYEWMSYCNVVSSDLWSIKWNELSVSLADYTRSDKVSSSNISTSWVYRDIRVDYVCTCHDFSLDNLVDDTSHICTNFLSCISKNLSRSSLEKTIWNFNIDSILSRSCWDNSICKCCWVWNYTFSKSCSCSCYREFRSLCPWNSSNSVVYHRFLTHWVEVEIWFKVFKKGLIEFGLEVITSSSWFYVYSHSLGLL